MRRALQQVIRSFHVLAFSRGLPERMALYLHQVPKSQHPALVAMIQALRSHGFTFVTAETYRSSLETKQVALTFDDNYQSWLTLLDLLQQQQVAATFFVNTLPSADPTPAALADYVSRIGCSGDYPGVLSPADLESIASAGHTLGNHTHSHPRFSEISDDAAMEDIVQCQHWLSRLAPSPSQFALPYGMQRLLAPSLVPTIQQLGLEIALGTPGLLHRPAQQGCWHRSPWRLDKSVRYNLTNLAVDGYWFERITGRAAAV